MREKFEYLWRVKLEEKKLKLYWKCKVTFILKQFFLVKVTLILKRREWYLELLEITIRTYEKLHNICLCVVN